MTTTESEATHSHDYDVVIVGGGPAGCSAGVFCAREGLDTVIFDRGRSSLKRCAYLENYPGFPAGIDIETLYALMHDHAETAGCEIVPDLVESVERTDDEGGFHVTPQEGDPVTARRVVAATRYDGEYMRGLDDNAAMFETHEHDGEEHEHFDSEYADHDGTTSVEGLYVASPSEEADTQAIMAAGRGARVAHRVIADARMDDGWWEEVAEGVDWVRREAELDDEWADRDRWVEWFNNYYGEDAPVEADSERFQRVREAKIDDWLSSYVSLEEIDERAAVGQEALAAHLDVERLIAAVDDETLLNHVDDELIRERARDIEATEVNS
ncbi:NAD(P)/FAD-dependent oxidoreductase [Natronomonas sp. EA1]|uniref:NAD(P)/FAD-dependent oxidoreductase n=1 Tax=Natronomonas sp. EA1 TaxID=3421655 RepID=UPI003EBCFB36